MGELVLMGVDVDDVADYGVPVELTSKSIYPVKALVRALPRSIPTWHFGWVATCSSLSTSSRSTAKASAALPRVRATLARWLLLVLLGALQAIIVTVGDLVIGVQCVNPLLFVLGGIAISFTYVNIIYALSTTFKHIGKAIGVILVIVRSRVRRACTPSR